MPAKEAGRSDFSSAELRLAPLSPRSDFSSERRAIMGRGEAAAGGKGGRTLNQTAARAARRAKRSQGRRRNALVSLIAPPLIVLYHRANIRFLVRGNTSGRSSFLERDAFPPPPFSSFLLRSWSATPIRWPQIAASQLRLILIFPGTTIINRARY